MGLAKKLEGNPQHPVNQGKLCARGQAGLQVLYHPDRITHPIKRTVRRLGRISGGKLGRCVERVAAHLATLQASGSTDLWLFWRGPERAAPAN